MPNCSVTTHNELEAENAQLRALLDKVGMDRSGTAGTLMGAEEEVRTLQLQLSEARESCAKIAEGWKVTDPTNTIGPLWVMGFNDACQEIASQIRTASIMPKPKRHNPHDHAYGICDPATCEECKSLKRLCEHKHCGTGKNGCTGGSTSCSCECDECTVIRNIYR